MKPRLCSEFTCEDLSDRDPKKEFELYVLYVVYGSEGFGTRDSYIIYKEPQARIKAIEEKIYRLLQAKFPHLVITPFVQKSVTRQARKLYEAIKDVPPPNGKGI